MTAFVNILLALFQPLVFFIVGNLSDANVKRLASFLSFLFRVFNRPGVHLIRENLQFAYPEKSKKELDELTQANIKFTIWNWFEFIRMIKQPGLDKRLLTEVDKDTKAVPTKVIVCLAHIGNWELFARLASTFFPDITAIAADYSKYPRLNDLLVNSRKTTGLKIIYKEGGARGCLRALQSGSAIAIVMDQNLSERHGGMFVNFYHLPVPVTPLPAMLALHSKLPIYAAACVRKPDDSFKIIFREVKIGGETDKNAIMQKIMDANERIIRDYPEQYIWLYKRWASIPKALLDNKEEILKKYPSYTRKKYKNK